MKKIFIGIDVSKETIDVSVLNPDESTDAEYLGQYANVPSGYSLMIKDIRCMGKVPADGQWLFCCETTGAYDRPMCYWLVEHGHRIWRESALQIKRSMGIRRGKNDKADSMMIAEYAWRHADKAHIFQKPDRNLAALKDLFLYRQSLVDKRKAAMVRSGEAKGLAGASSDAARFIRRDAAKEVRRLEQSIEQCEQQIMKIIQSDESLDKNYRHVTSVKGMGFVSAVALIVFSGNFQAIHTANKMATYCGVASFRERSGTTLDRRADVSSLSNRRLKGILTMAALLVVRFNTDIKLYFDRLMSAGKPYGIALNNVKNKLLHIAYSLVKNDCDFELDHERKRKERLALNINI